MSTNKKKKPKRRPGRRKRLPLDEALRRERLDEIGYAEGLGGFFHQLDGTTSVPKLKLKLDGLKELVRHLEPKRSASAADSDEPVVVQLVHNVARPSRTEPAKTAEEPGMPGTDETPDELGESPPR